MATGDGDKLGERFLLVRCEWRGQAGTTCLAVLEADGIAKVLRPLSEGDDARKVLEWLQPDCDGIRSGQLNWQRQEQAAKLRAGSPRGPSLADATAARKDIEAARRGPANLF